MADTVNGQITDAVTQTNVKVLGESPAQSLSLVYQSLAHSLSLAAQNATTTQHNMQQIGTAVVSTACNNILSLSKGS